jgi:hypothetical protein
MQMGISLSSEKTFSTTCICDANGDSSLPTKSTSNHLHKRIYGDNFSMTTNMIGWATDTNTVNIVHKLVTIFAGHLDNFIVINNHFKHLYYTATSGSGQINVQMTLIQFAGICKNCAIPSAHRDSFPGLPGQDTSRLLRRVRFPNYIAVPLGCIWSRPEICLHKTCRYV